MATTTANGLVKSWMSAVEAEANGAARAAAASEWAQQIAAREARRSRESEDLAAAQRAEADHDNVRMRAVHPPRM